MSDWTHLEDTTPTARKPHLCYLCEREIPIGSRHVRRAGVTADGFLAFRMHEECEKLTHGWDEDSWSSHDAIEFRRWDLDIKPEESWTDHHPHEGLVI